MTRGELRVLLSRREAASAAYSRSRSMEFGRLSSAWAAVKAFFADRFDERRSREAEAEELGPTGQNPNLTPAQRKAAKLAGRVGGKR